MNLTKYVNKLLEIIKNLEIKVKLEGEDVMKEKRNRFRRSLWGSLALSMILSISSGSVPYLREGEQTVSLSSLESTGGGVTISLNTEISNAVPTLGASTPEIGASTPEIGVATPEIGMTQPDTAGGQPEIPVDSPEINVATPDVVPDIVGDVEQPERPENTEPSLQGEPPKQDAPEIGFAVPDTGEHLLFDEGEGEVLSEGEEYLEVHGDANVDESPSSIAVVQEDGKTSVTITLPNGDKGEVYNYGVTLVKTHWYNGELVKPTDYVNISNNMITYIDDTGTIQEEKFIFQENFDEEGNYVNRSLADWLDLTVRGGTTITVHNLMPSDTGRDTPFDTLLFGVAVTNLSDYGKNVEFASNPIVIADEASSNNFSGTVIDWSSTNTDNATFQSLNGQYTLVYLLNRYNAVAFGETSYGYGNLEGSHIVGPVIALGHATRNGYSTAVGKDVGTLVVADYSGGQFSYIGDLLANPNLFQSPFVNLNYQFDRDEDTDKSFVTPYLYTKATGQYVVELGYAQQYIVRAETAGDVFLSPNYSGFEEVYQNDGFITQSSLAAAVTSGSADIKQNGYLSWDNVNTPKETAVFDLYDAKTDNSSTRYIEVTYGGSYEITNETIPKPGDWYVVMNFTDHEYGDGDQFPTIINLDASALKVDQNDSSKYVFPQIKVRYAGQEGVDPNELGGLNLDIINDAQEGKGKDVEYNIHGNKVVWNLHNFTDKLRFPENFNNVPGHILLPFGTVQNYYGTLATGSWGGGNLNGCLIAQNIEIGIMEVHMWPYGGEGANVEDEYDDMDQGSGGSGSTDTGHVLPETGGRVDLFYLSGGVCIGFGLILFWIARKQRDNLNNI